MQRMVRSAPILQQSLHHSEDEMTTFRSTNPARPAELVAELPSHTAADVDQAVQQAAEAQRAWATRPVPERAEAIAAAGAVLTAKKAELAELVSREAGKVR